MTEDRTFDRQAFDAWAGPHVDCMVRAARRVLPSEDMAWDAVQNVLLRFWRDPRRLEDPRAALLSVVTRASLEQLRRQRRRRHHEERAHALRADHDHELCEDPACRLERAEFVEWLHEAVRDLPDDCREALAMREFDGLDYAAIAARLAIPIGTVRSRLSRARRLLGERLQREESLAHGPPAA